jgi:hypothetical protein
VPENPEASWLSPGVRRESSGESRFSWPRLARFFMPAGVSENALSKKEFKSNVELRG